MNKILNMILSVVVLGFSFTALAVAPGTDPNDTKNDQVEAGTLMPGTDFSKQAKVCKTCENSNRLLTDGKGKFSIPGINNTGSSSTSGEGQGTN